KIKEILTTGYNQTVKAENYMTPVEDKSAPGGKRMVMDKKAFNNAKLHNLRGILSMMQASSRTFVAVVSTALYYTGVSKIFKWAFDSPNTNPVAAGLAAGVKNES